MKTPEELLPDLISSSTLVDAEELVEQLVDGHAFSWRPVGDKENNFGQINIGSDPGLAMIERVTNALDGVLELEFARSEDESVPLNPRDAVERWFGVESGRIRNLDTARRQELADAVTVSLHPGTAGRRFPTVRVRDLGIGLSPAAVPDTILGLSEDNKIDKPFLAGAYGQGGSTTLAFCPDGSVIASRRHPDLWNGAADAVAITFVRFRDLDPLVNKNGRYEYLVTPAGEVPAVNAASVDFAPGTLVTHFNYELPRHSSALTQVTGSLWWLLQNALFDPVLPIWAEDHRPRVTKQETALRRTIVGNHARLWRDSREKLEHSDSVQVIVPGEDGDSRIVAHYWVVVLPEDGGKRQTPINVYVDPVSPLAYTYFGQTHGHEDRRYVRNRLQLPYLDRYMVLQVELDQLTPRARRQLLSTTRDRLKESAFYSEMRDRLATALAEDHELQRLNLARKDALLSSYSESERQRMRERFAKLMDRLTAGRDATVPSKGEGEQGRPRSKSRSREPLEPLPTAEAPTFVRIANKRSPIPIAVDRAALLRLESDAPNGYLAAHAPHARILLVADPEDSVVMESVSDFRGGRSRVVVRPGSDIQAGTRGSFDVFLFAPGGESYHARAKYVITEPRKKKTQGDSGMGAVKAPEPVPINRDQWDSLGWSEASVAQVEVDATGARILVNMDNQHIGQLLKTGGYKEQGLSRMKANYLLYTAYYAWLQHRALECDDHSLSGEEFESYQQDELDRASRTVVSAIAAEGRLD